MKAINTTLLLLALHSTLCLASAGSWSQQSSGGTLTTGEELLVGRVIHAPTVVPRNAPVKYITWKINLLTPPPQGLEINLCSTTWCQPLPALAGHLTPTHHLSAGGIFHFIYNVRYKGQLIPAMTVVKNQLTIGYGSQS
ncbi:flagellar protein FlhE [Escherichia coli]|nr:flagellar protein FlhE [Escherichia coli]